MNEQVNDKVNTQPPAPTEQDLIEEAKRKAFLATTQVREVIIVGGGTAGWVTALALNTYCPYVNIRLIQPKNGSSIGVGESTQPDLIKLLIDANIDHREFIMECDATFKCGIYYEDWNKIGDNFWHPFSPMASQTTYTAAHHYQQMILREPEKYNHKDYYDAVHPSYALCVKHNFVDESGPGALHVDADKMHAFLRKKLPNVRVLEPDNMELFSDEDKLICIDCDGEKVFADLFVDCTGFKRVLIKEIGNAETDYYHENVETALFARIPYVDKPNEMVPYTKAHAQKHGWIWTIPLASRIGSGYVYTQNSCTQDEAEAEFIAYWGEERLKGVQFKHIEFSSLPLTDPWQKNVVAIGLSAGFVEPLEATGINWSITGATLLAKYLGRSYFDYNTRIMYNANMRNYIQDVQDFVDVHYKLSDRRDSTLWQYHTTRLHHPRLKKKLEIYKREMPASWNRPKLETWAFNEVSWIDILNGYEFKFDKVTPDPKMMEDAVREMKRMKSLNKGRLENGKTVYQLLNELYDTPSTQRVEKLHDNQYNSSSVD